MLIFDVWSISSKLRPDENIKVFFVGKSDDLDKNYFRNLILNENYDENYLGKVWIWSIFFFYWRLRKKYDLIIVQNKMKICNLFKSNKRFVVPDWISCEINLDSDLRSQSISKKAYTTYIRLMKKSDFGYTISKDPSHFISFYNSMYLPYLSNRHGNLGLEVSLDRMKRSFENGELLYKMGVKLSRVH